MLLRFYVRGLHDGSLFLYNVMSHRVMSFLVREVVTNYKLTRLAKEPRIELPVAPGKMIKEEEVR